MFKNYFKIAFRNFLRNKTGSIINILGLTIGLASSILILLYIKFELSYDNFHKDADRIYRVYIQQPQNLFMGTDKFNATPAPLVPAMKEEIPGVEYASRLVFASGYVKYGNRRFQERKFYLADPDFFHVFSFPLISGDPETLLNDPYSIVITSKIASKYFGEENPVGKYLNFQLRDESLDLKVTGVLEDIPDNSHFFFDFIGHFELTKKIWSNTSLNNWGECSFHTYIKLHQGVDPSEIENTLVDIVKRYRGKENKDRYFLQQTTDIHLFGHINFELGSNSSVQTVYIFGSIAFFILLIACFNYMNLTTAQSSKRSREVGIRKVVGSNRRQLVFQFLGESVIMSVLALLLALIIAEIFLPSFNIFINRNLKLYSGDGSIFLLFISVTIIVGLISGSYPAMFLSKFQPINAIKGEVSGTKFSAVLRDVLVLVQFIISISLMICTSIIYRQLHYIKNKNLGFETEHILTIPIGSDNIRNNYKILKNEFISNPQIVGVTASGYLPSSIRSQSDFEYEGMGNNKKGMAFKADVDFDFIDFYGIKLLEGTNFSESAGTDSISSYIINETAVKKLGWADPIGKSLSFKGEKARIIGVVKDFHFNPLYLKIQPVVLRYNPSKCRILSIKIRPDNIKNTISYIEETLNKYTPDTPFVYAFLDEKIDATYKDEVRLGQMINFFTILAVLIACLGLYGLATFVAEQKIKEIGIRKVFGASSSGIVYLVSQKFIKWVLLANIIAWPFAWFAMNRWLEGFAYRINISFWTFMVSTVVALLIAFATVLYQSLKTANSNPVDSLKYE